MLAAPKQVKRFFLKEGPRITDPLKAPDATSKVGPRIYGAWANRCGLFLQASFNFNASARKIHPGALSGSIPLFDLAFTPSFETFVIRIPRSATCKKLVTCCARPGNTPRKNMG